MLLLFLLLPSCYVPPVRMPITEPFVAPACAYCPGHRGVEYDLDPGTAVHAAATGEVTFSGVVAGIRYVVVSHPDGIRATYGMLLTTTLRSGDTVRVHEVIATSTSRLYFGLRSRDGVPLDPADHLAVFARRARLVPSDGSQSRPPRTRAPACPSVAETRTSPR